MRFECLHKPLFYKPDRVNATDFSSVAESIAGLTLKEVSALSLPLNPLKGT